MRKLSPAMFVLMMVPVLVFARTYDTSNLPYSDVSDVSRAAAIAISTLTDEGILEGNPDGTFRPYQFLNRAEFMKIVMGLTEEEPEYSLRCFADVPESEWYAVPVCRAKALGIVRGNAIEGVPPPQWLFVPGRPVNYVEAVKVLVELYSLPHQETLVWYDGYLDAALEAELALESLDPSALLTRGDMARLVNGFLAHDRGELVELRRAERGEVSESSSSVSPALPASSSSSSSASSIAGATYDSDPNTAIRSQFLLLGETTPVLGAIDIFSNDEPMDVRTVKVNITAVASSTVQSFLLYDQSKRYLGRAFLDTSSSTNRTYTVNLPSGTFIAPKREEVSIYARAHINHKDQGGVTQTTVQVSSFLVEGTGVWSSNHYTMASSETFLPFQTSRSIITRIANDGQAEGVLIPGDDREIGEFVFEGRVSDSQAKIQLSSVTFQVSTSSNVSVQNAELGVKGFPTKISCTTSATQIVCSSLPDTYSSLKGDPKRLVVFGDVSLLDDNDAALQLGIPAPGSVSASGSIEWTDGTATFTWVQFDPPVVVSTHYSR